MRTTVVLLQTGNEQSSGTLSPTAVNIITGALLVLVLTAIYLFVKSILRRHFDQLTRQEEQELQAFEQLAFQNVHSCNGLSDKQEPDSLSSTSPILLNEIKNPDDLIQRLIQAHIFRSEEGNVHIPDDGITAKSISISNGKTALISPSPLSPNSLSLQSKKFDYVFQILENGEVLVTERYSTFIGNFL